MFGFALDAATHFHGSAPPNQNNCCAPVITAGHLLLEVTLVTLIMSRSLCSLPFPHSHMHCKVSSATSPLTYPTQNSQPHTFTFTCWTVKHITHIHSHYSNSDVLSLPSHHLLFSRHPPHSILLCWSSHFVPPFRCPYLSVIRSSHSLFCFVTTPLRL